MFVVSISTTLRRRAEGRKCWCSRFLVRRAPAQHARQALLGRLRPLDLVWPPTRSSNVFGFVDAALRNRPDLLSLNALSSIVEINQAQLNLVAAQIGYATTQYEYLTHRSALVYQVGALK